MVIPAWGVKTVKMVKREPAADSVFPTFSSCVRRLVRWSVRPAIRPAVDRCVDSAILSDTLRLTVGVGGETLGLI